MAHWTEAERDVIRRAAAGEISRADAFVALPHRSMEAVNKKIGREGDVVFRNDDWHEPTPLSPGDPGDDDGEFEQRCHLAAVASTALLERIHATLHQDI